MRAIRRWGVILGTLLSALAGARADDYPVRPIHVIVAFVPGGATDTMTRQIQQDLGAAPDGYTLLMAENALAISQGLFKQASSTFDPVKQYDAIAHVATSPLALVVADRVKANSVGELIALAHAMAPQKMNYASAGIGSVAHLAFEVFRDAAGIDAVHVPHKGGGAPLARILGGQVEMHMASIQVAAGLAKAGKL